MAQYIDKSSIITEIRRLLHNAEAYLKYHHNKNDELVYSFKHQKLTMCELLSFIDSLEVKEVEEYKQPEYSCFETTYKCGKKPHWNIGDVLTYYEFYSDREGEHVLGKVINVELDEEQSDWFYTFEDGSQYAEELLLENETYTK